MPAKLVAVSQFLPSAMAKADALMPTAEDLIVYCARVSNPANQENFDSGARLLRYCISHGHWSVFEMANMCVEVVTSRAVGRQIIRHRSFSFQEFSQRYAKADTTLDPIELRLQGKKRQGGEDIAPIPEDLIKKVQEHLQGGMVLYNQLLKEGVAFESARLLLPELTQTTMYINGTVRSWIHYLQQRCTPETQKEHRLLANEIRDIFMAEFPTVSAAIGWGGDSD